MHEVQWMLSLIKNFAFFGLVTSPAKHYDAVSDIVNKMENVILCSYKIVLRVLYVALVLKPRHVLMEGPLPGVQGDGGTGCPMKTPKS